jgi:hypothetical protein
MTFEVVKAVYDEKGVRSLVPTGEPDAFFAVRHRADCRGAGKCLSLDRGVTVASSLTSGVCP